MATAHVYARVQVTGTNEQVQAIVDAAQKLQDAVEAAGADWRGSTSAELDPVEPPAAAGTA